MSVPSPFLVWVGGSSWRECPLVRVTIESSSSVRVSLRVSLQRIVAWLLHSLRASGRHVSLCAPLPFVELRGKRRLGVLGHRVQEALRDVFRDQILAEQ